MIYDTPKAAHFDAWFRGGKLAPLDPIGLGHRWMAAHKIKEHVCQDMRQCTGSVRDDVRCMLIGINTQSKDITVTLSGECPICCGIGARDSGGFRSDGLSIDVPCECQESTNEVPGIRAGID